MLALLGILSVVGIVGGAIIQGIGNVATAQAQAKADQTKADQLEELSKKGGYYDQVLASINLDLQDIESDRQTAGKMFALNAINTAEQGAQATGAITARSAAGNLSGGSVDVQKEMVQTQTERSLMVSRLQYEDQLRGLDIRKAQDISQQTMTKFNQQAGLTEAAQLTSEADWLNTWGVGLGIASAVFGGLAGLAGLKAPQASTPGSTVQEPPVPFDPYAAHYGTQTP